MWNYYKIKGGCIRSKSLGSAEEFMFRMLTNKKTKSIWRKIIGYTWCNILRHGESGVVVGEGYSSIYGNFEIQICKNCHSGIIFYEGER